jgi:hypothetical protein
MDEYQKFQNENFFKYCDFILSFVSGVQFPRYF